MTIEHKIVLALKWNTAAKLCSQLVSWTVTLVVLRILAPADYGTMAIVMVVMTIVGGIAEFGIGASLVQTPDLERHVIARIAGVLSLLNLACGLAVALSAPWLADWFGQPELTLLIQVAAVQFLFSAIEVVPQAILQRQLDFARIARIEMAAALVAALGTLALAWWGAGVWSLVLGWLAGSALRASLFAAGGRFIWPQISLSGIGGHVRFGGTVTVSRMIWQITQQMDALIAGRLLTRDILGLYAVALNLATLPMNKLMGIVNQVALSAVSRMQDEPARLRARLLDAIRLLTLVSIPCLWGLSCIAPELIHVALGPKWEPATIALQLVSLIAPARMLLAILSTALTGVGRADKDLHNTLIGAVILITCLLIGVRWQLVGLAAAWLVAIPLTAIACIPRTARTLGLSIGEIFGALRVPVLGGCAMYACVSLARALLPQLESAWLLVLLILVGAASYAGTVLSIDRTVITDLKRVGSALRR